jgi:hypothetical protein
LINWGQRETCQGRNSEVDGAKVRVSGDDRIEEKVDGGERSDKGGGGNRGLEAVATGRASHAPVDPRSEATEGAGDEEGGGRPLLLDHRIEVSGRRGGKVNGTENGTEGASGLDQLHQFGVAGEKPLGTEGAGESRLESERGARGVEVQDGNRARGDRGRGGARRMEPGGGGRSQGGQRGAGIEEGDTR